MEGKKGIKVTNYWSCVNGRNVESDSSTDNQDEMPSSSSSSSASSSQRTCGIILRRRQEGNNDNAAIVTTTTSEDTSVRAADSTSTTTMVTMATSTSGPQPLTRSNLSLHSSTWTDSDGPADSTVASPDEREANLYFEDNEDNEGLVEQEIDIDLSDDNRSTTVEGSHSFDLADMFLEDEMMGSEDKENDQPPSLRASNDQ